MTQLEQPMAAALRFLQIAAEGGAVTILNPAPAAALPDGTLALCDYLTPNEHEAEALTGIAVTDLPSAIRAAQALLAQGVRRAVIVTLGGAGAVVVECRWRARRGADAGRPGRGHDGCGRCVQRRVCDAALAEGRVVWTEALRFATAVAALSVTKPGTAASMPARDEVAALLAHGRAVKIHHQPPGKCPVARLPPDARPPHPRAGRPPCDPVRSDRRGGGQARPDRCGTAFARKDRIPACRCSGGTSPAAGANGWHSRFPPAPRDAARAGVARRRSVPPPGNCSSGRGSS